MGGKRLFCVFICVYGARKKRLTNFNICAGQLSSRCKMDSDEFSLVIKKKIKYEAFIIKCRDSLTKRDELSFRTVLAFPNDSKTGFVLTTCSSKLALFCKSWLFSLYSLAPTEAKYEITFFVFSVFPAPDSPLSKSM